MNGKDTTVGSSTISTGAGIVAGLAANYITARFGIPVSADWLIGLASLVTGAVHYFTHRK